MRVDSAQHKDLGVYRRVGYVERGDDGSLPLSLRWMKLAAQWGGLTSATLSPNWNVCLRSVDGSNLGWQPNSSQRTPKVGNYRWTSKGAEVTPTEYFGMWSSRFSSTQRWPMPCSSYNLRHLSLRRLMSYIYGAPILDVSRSHTTTQHSR